MRERCIRCAKPVETTGVERTPNECIATSVNDPDCVETFSYPNNYKQLGAMDLEATG